MSTIVSLALPFIFIMFIVQQLVLPMVYVFVDFTPFLTNDVFVTSIRDTLLIKGYSMGEILLYYIFTVSGGVIIPIIIMIFLTQQFLALGAWINGKIIPYKSLTVFWNGIPTSETKLYKRINKESISNSNSVQNI